MGIDHTNSFCLLQFIQSSTAGRKIIQQGNELYKKQQYEQATMQYEKAIEADSSNTTAIFNLGNSLL
jgi:Tfp pilus assembly protein PilF